MAKRIYTRTRVRNASVRKDPRLLESLIETLMRQQGEILARRDKEEFQLVSEFYGASGTYVAVSREEALAKMAVREEQGNQVFRSYAYRGDFPLR